ncbi:hypothetical protein KZZ52_37510 [Dactylosporangium sp. AC04546]|nr:hypothetical protein [Dactylosporangium sp. AC04546]WVK79663.1 hypothetical protein KZZ52_37510 [Dactylosporangium sp. AC04546]
MTSSVAANTAGRAATTHQHRGSRRTTASHSAVSRAASHSAQTVTAW